MKVIILVGGFLLYALNGGVSATSLGWKGDPVISSVADMPAICLPGDADSFPVYRVMVSESFLKKSAYWALYLEPNAQPVVMKPGDCITFGEELKGYSREGGLTPSMLRPNHTYSFSMDRVRDDNHYNYFYVAAFCVREDTKGSRQYPQYIRLSDAREIVPACDARRNNNVPE